MVRVRARVAEGRVDPGAEVPADAFAALSVVVDLLLVAELDQVGRVTGGGVAVRSREGARDRQVDSVRPRRALPVAQDGVDLRAAQDAGVQVLHDVVGVASVGAGILAGHRADLVVVADAVAADAAGELVPAHAQFLAERVGEGGSGYFLWTKLNRVNPLTKKHFGRRAVCVDVWYSRWI